MGYALHVEDCTAAEVTRAVEGLRRVRIVGGPVSATNPATGETVTIGGPDDLRLEFRIRWRWRPGFWFSRDRLSIQASFDPTERRDPVTRLVFDVADALGRPLVGDEGEEYRRP